MTRTTLALTWLLLSCGAPPTAGPPRAPASPASPASPAGDADVAPAPASPPPPDLPADDNTALDRFFDEYDRASLARSPQAQSYRAIKTDYGRWDDPSDEAAARNHQAALDALAALTSRFADAVLDPAHRLSYELFEDHLRRIDEAYAFRDHGYVFNQMRGAQSQLPAFLINIHAVTSRADAEAYVARLEGLGPTLRAYLAVSVARAARGVTPPRWVYPFVIEDARNVITGAPFGDGPDCALLADFKGKLAALKLPDAEAAPLLAAAETALLASVRPAYNKLISVMVAQQRTARAGDGVWRLPRGAAYYAERVRAYTTTSLTPDEIHALGLREVARLHGEMRALMGPLGFRGSFAAFLRHMRDRRDIYFANDAGGRAAYLDATRRALDEITALLPQAFGTLPRAALVVKPVESFREKSAGKAFYQRAAPDGSRPGTYYVNLFDMAAMPNTEIEALAFHEGVPGHHLQLSLQSERGELPAFRKFGGIAAYSEGWGLYAEKLAKELGQYRDPLRDFGRLQLELHRAIRLVVDTGVHHLRWTRARAIRYVTDNSAEPFAAARKSIERYLVYPGQATAYMIGRLKIVELRERAAAELGPAFDLRTFHDLVLGSGPVPLEVLEREISRWITGRKTH
ncbi:MAG: DUF885 domain-containing protein [Kofleriaceae bacterium]